MPIDTRDWYREDYERKQKQEHPPFKRVDHRKYYEDGKHSGGGRKMPKALKILLTIIVVVGALFCFFWFTGCLGWLADGALPVWLEARLDGVSVPGGYGMSNKIGAKNPTYDELVEFIKRDQTDKNPYGAGYKCLDYARDVHNNAEANGIRAGVVFLNPNSRAEWGFDRHALNAFDTVDQGLVFIDCTSYDTRAYVTVGEIYDVEPLYSGAIADNAFVWSMVGTVEEYRIYWW